MKQQRGSALITVLLLTTGLLIIAASVIQLSVGERRLNHRNNYWLKSRMGAEAIVEYGFSQVRNQFEAQATPPTFRPGSGNPLVLPPTDFYAGSGIVTTAWSTSNTNGMEVVGGPIQTLGLVYIDPNDPNNEYDPMKGLWIVRRDIVVIGRATYVPPTGMGPPISSYIQQTISVRGAPLFAHAIFYARDDLEIFPGPEMNIRGPVHTNGNLFVSSQGNANGVRFWGHVSAVGGVYHAWKNSNSAAQGSGGETLGQTPVSFLSNDNTTLRNLNLTGTATGWMDSTTGLSNGVSGLSSLQALVTQNVTSTFRQRVVQNWGGNLQTGAMGVQIYDPIAYNSQIGVDGSGNPVTADPHSLIEPPAPPATTDPYYDAKAQIENQKFSTQAKLYVKVSVSNPSAGTATAATIRFYGPSNTGATGTGPNAYVELTAPTNMSGATPLLKWKPYTATKKVVGNKVNSGANANKYPVTTSTITAAGEGVGTTVYSASLPAKVSATSGTMSANTTDIGVTEGMYDQRRLKGVDLLEVDMGKLRTAVQNMSTGTNNADTIKNPDGSVFTDWNGAVYIEIDDTSGRHATVNQAGSVRLVNGTVASGSSLVPSFGPNGNGLTIATDSPLYIKGHFNADGSIAAASATTPDDGHSGASSSPSVQSPVCLASDAITILSSTFDELSSAVSVSPNTDADTEIAAAFLTGNTVTTNSASSGGAHNFPRFLESWGGETVAIRGSIVAMFRSAVASEPWAIRYYGAPNRNWGFDSTFANGTFPPLTPRVLSFRRVAFKTLSASEYATTKAALWP